MTNQYSITPPPQLVKQWEEDWHHSKAKHIEYESYLATLAAQWAADQELEACIDFVRRGPWCSEKLRAARRPKPPTLAEKALEQYDRCVSILEEKGYSPAGCIRAALERLKQLEDSNE